MAARVLLLTTIAGFLAAASKNNMLDDSVDPQIEDDAVGIEWLPASEIRRRMHTLERSGKAGAQASVRQLKVSLENAKRKDDPWGLARVRQPDHNDALLQQSNGNARRAQDVSPSPTPDGPLYPVFEEDLEPNINETFSRPVALVRDDGSVFVPVPVPTGCDTTAIATCKAELKKCLGAALEDKSEACHCFLDHGKCYRKPGCIELLPRDDVTFCFANFMCNYDQCVGNGALGLGPFGTGGVIAIAAAAVATLMLAVGARDACQ